MLFTDVGGTQTISIPEPAPVVSTQIAAKPETKQKRIRRKATKAPTKVVPKKVAPVKEVAMPAPLAPTKAAPIQVAAAGSAQQAVKKVQAFYNSTKSFTSTFTQTVTNQTFNRRKPKVSQGKVYILKPGKMRFDYADATKKSVSKSFISDGKSLWAVMHNNKQYYKSSLAGSALPTAVSFLMGTGDLLKDFDVSFEKAGKYGSKNDILLLLIPKSPSARYKKLWLVINPADYSVKESIVLNSKNDTNSIRFRAVKINEGKLKPGHFIFNAKANKNYRLVTPPKSGNANNSTTAKSKP